MKKGLNKENVGALLVVLTALISGIAVAVHKYFIMWIDSLVFTALRAFFIGIVFLFLSLYFTRNQKKVS